uniref:Uncharacterized protein n=1 Tax=Anguilla anguilla TaxID=7936 RepID=A0A0E9U0Z5_ANGAN
MVTITLQVRNVFHSNCLQACCPLKENRKRKPYFLCTTILMWHVMLCPESQKPASTVRLFLERRGEWFSMSCGSGRDVSGLVLQ